MRPCIERFLISIVCAAILTVMSPGIRSGAALAGLAAGVPEPIVGYQDSAGEEYAVIVEKKSQQLFLYHFQNGEFREILRFSCSTGKSPGRKLQSGDSKTPEGVYFFVQEHQDKDLSPIYGVKAFPIDYPNLMDRQKGRSGNSIWLHGTNKPMKQRDSNGCIVLEDADLLKISEYITLNRTPIIIVEEIRYRPAGRSADEREAVFSLVSGWTRALTEGTYHEFLEYYDAGYLPDIDWWPLWRRSRKPLDGSRDAVSVVSENMAVFQYDNAYVAIFDQLLRGDGITVSLGVKKMFFAMNHGELRIVGDGFQKIYGQKTGISGVKTNPLIAGLQRFETMRSDPNAGIAKMVDSWIQAWSSKDIQRYGGFYAKDFVSSGKNLQQYLKYKEGLNRKYKTISVQKEKMIIDVGARTSTVSFVQTYQSSGYKAVGIKQLVLKKEGSQWKIYREDWKSL